MLDRRWKQLEDAMRSVARRPTRFRPVLAAALLIAPALIPSHAGAGASVGVCNITLRFTFSGVISNQAPPRSYTMTGSGTCQTSAGLGKTIAFGQTGGTATTAHCVPLIMSGSYSVNFFPDPAPASSNGEFNFIGTASGGEARMNGSNPTFVGVAALAGGGLIGCGGSDVLTFTTVLVFADP
ncbi:MAG: hypothetical protein ACRDKG_07740 [Actinomycetota bacterium]